ANSDQSIGAASPDFKQAAAVAMFGMLLRDSQQKGNSTYDAVLEIAGDAGRDSGDSYREEFLEMVERAKELAE
ncbi:MAG: YfbK domain-containing protein, partial [Pirellulales bacterium]